MKKKARRIIVFAVFFLGLLALLLHLPFVRNAALDRGLRVAERRFGLEIEASSLRYNLFRLEFTLKEISLRRAGEPELPPLLTAEQIYGRLPLSFLFGKKIHFKELKVQGPRLNIFRDEKGLTNLPLPPRAGDRKPAGARRALPEIIIDSFLAQDVDFVYWNRAGATKIELTDGRIDIRWLGRGTHSLAVELGSGGSIDYRGKKFPVEAFLLRADIGGDEATVHKATLRSGRSEIALTGSIQDYFHPLLDLSVQGRISLDDLKARLHLRQEISGIVEFDSHLEGPLQAVSARAELRVDNLAYEGHRGLTFQSDLIWQERTLIASAIRMSALGGEVEGEGRFHPFDHTSSSQVDLKWKNIDPVPLLRPLQSPVDVSTRSSGSLRLSWTEPTIDSLAGRANIQFDSPREVATASATVPLSGKAGLEVGAGKIRLVLDGVSLGGAFLGGAFQSAAGRLSGKFRADIEDLGTLSSYLPRSAISRLAKHPASFSLRGRLSLSGKVGGTLKKPQIEGELQGRDMSLAGLEGLGLDGHLAFDGEALQFKPLTLSFQGGRAKLDGTYRLRSPRPLDLDTEVRQWPAESVLRIMGAAEDASAELDLDSRLSGSLSTPAFELKGRLSRVRFRKQDLGDIPFEARSDGRSVEFEARAPSLSVSAKGGFSFDHPRPLRLHFDFDNLPLDRVIGLVLSAPPPGLSGVASGRVDLSAEPGKQGKTLAFDLGVSSLQFGTERFRLASSREFSISYGREGLTVMNLYLKDEVNQFSVEGSLPWRGDTETGLNISARLDLGSLAGLFPNAQGEGILTFQARVRGSFSHPRFWSESAVVGGKWRQGEGLSLQDIRADLELDDDAIHIREASFRWQSGSYRIQGEVPLESLPFKPPFFAPPLAGKPARLSLLFSGLSPADPAAILQSPGFKRVKGAIDGRVTITAERFNLDSLSAAAEFSRLELDLPGLQLVQENPSRIRLERGRIFLDRLSLVGGGNRLQAAGTLGLLQEREVDLGLKGDTDLQMLQAFIANSEFSGRGAYEITFTGSLPRPRMAGFIEFLDGGFIAPRFHLHLSRLNGRLLVRENRLDVEGLSGLLNGGKVEAGGSLLFEGFSLKSSDLRISGEDVFLDYPKGFSAETGFALQFILRDEKPSLGGTITIQTAEYVGPFNIQSELYRYLKRRRARDQASERRPFFSRLNFDIQVVIRDVISIRNNLVKGQLQGELKLSGTPYQPVLAGRVLVAEGGEVYFSRTTYEIEQGQVAFVNPSRIEPDINLQAHTRVSGYDIKLLLSGTPDKFSADLTSDPPLPESDIISLLVTGKRLAYVSDNVLGAVGDRALSYLNNALAGELENLAKQKLGLDSVTIDAGLVSSQENPEARLTVGRHITPELEFILSQNLKQSQYTTVILNYKPLREINLRAVKQDNDAYHFDVQHEVRFGLAKKPVPPPGKKEGRSRVVKNLVLEGKLGLDESTVRRSLKLSPGKHFDFHRYHDDLDRLRRLYVKHDYLSHSISAKREEKDGGLTLIYRVESGPKILLGYEGAKVPAALKQKIRALWIEGKLRSLAGDDIREEIRRHFSRQGYYQVEVRQREARGAAGEQVVTFQVLRGIRYRDLEVDFKGVRSLSTRSLIAFLKKNRLLPEIFIDPQPIARSLEGFYKQRGFLLAQVGPPEVEFDQPSGAARAIFPVDEGPRFMVGRIELWGNLALADGVLVEAVRLRSGEVFSPPIFEAALDRLREVYARRGFNEAEIRGESRLDKERAVMDLAFEIKENRQDIVKGIEISGNSLTRERVVQRELAFGEGDVLDHYALNKSRKNLYDLGIFGSVQFTLKPEMESAGAQRPQTVGVDVTELNPFSLRYGFQYDTETKLGVVAELVNRNVFGTSQLVGTSFNLNRYERGAKVFFRSHYFLGKKINSEFFTFINRKILPGYTVDRTGLTLQQQIKFRQSWVLSYNYSFERNRVFNGAAGELEISEEAVNVGRLNVAVSANTRDDIMNPSHGTFFSQSLDYAAPALGSEVRFLRYFGQYFFIRKVTGPVSYALGLRLGLGKGFGRDLPLSERFFAGGGTSIRGFAYNEVGPKSPESRVPLGGDALFILNQELRCDIYKKLSGVVFLDVGNVYARAEDLNPIETRETAGVGLRLMTPVVLLRFDWGFKLDRRPGESRSAVHFSIGQAF
ncbi:MAG: outer membrane protein assembly factor BamA [Candidatus Aminicenantales bacterium]